MEQSKFGTFMIDDLYLYRASDDYKQVIEEKIVLPEYDKINQLKLLLSRTEYPISAKILIENGFSELTEELKENTGLKSCIIHHKLKGDQKVSIVELEKRISYFLCQSFIKNLDETRLLNLCLGESMTTRVKMCIESHLNTYNNVLNILIDYCKDLEGYDFQYQTAIKNKGMINLKIYIQDRLFIFLSACIGANYGYIVNSQYDLPIWGINISYDSKIRMYNYRSGTPYTDIKKEDLLSMIFSTPSQIGEVQKMIIDNIKLFFDINISLDDVCYDWSKDSYFVKPEVEKQIIGSFLNEDERDKDKDVVKYTSLQTLLATLISGKIRINSIVGMNDKTETNFMIDMIKNFREPIEEEGDEYLLANRKFITSFSGKKDDLNMWRLYGDNARGICMVFSFKSQQNSVLKKIQYVAEEDDIIKRLNQLMLSLKDLNINFYFYLLLNNQHFIKHKDYKDEDEYRFLLKNEQPVGWYINNDNNVLTPYTERELFRNGGNAFPFELKSIILGPAMVAKDVNLYQIKTLLRTKYKEINIKLSKIKSYR